MRHGNLSIAKITRPALPVVLPRERLFSLLDGGRSTPLVWISAPAGAGKTTLLASYLDARKLPCLWYQIDEGDADIATFFYYMGCAAEKAASEQKITLPLLTPQYQPGVPAFTRRYFETLCGCLKPPFVFVLDNYQNVPVDSPFHQLITAGLEAVPPGITILIGSRGGPPPPFARRLANGGMALLGWDDLMLTFEESKEAVKLRSTKKLSDGAQRQLYARTRGWFAGLVLTMECARDEALNARVLGQYIPEELFDYFASELFRNMDEESLDFLLKTALLAKITSRDAVRLTGNRHAGHILAELSRKNCFTEKSSLAEPTYQYHPLFREFLLREGEKTFPPPVFEQLSRKAAALMAKGGQTESAAELLIKVMDGEGLVQLVLGNAQQLIMQGRTKTLEEWFSHIPEAFFERSPWLLYWQGLCRLPFNAAAGRECFERAIQSFKDIRDETGVFLAWAAIVIAINHEYDAFTRLDTWIAWMEAALERQPVFVSRQVEEGVAVGMAIALWLRRPDHPDFTAWLDRALSLTRGATDTSLFVEVRVHAIWCALLRGDEVRKELLIDEVERMAKNAAVAPFHTILIKTIRTLASIFVQPHADRGILEVREGHVIIEESGLHAVGHQLYAFGVYCALNNGNLDLAGDFLARVRATVSSFCQDGLAHYHFLAGWHELLDGNISSAFARADEALSLTVRTGAPVPECVVRILMAHVLIRKKDYGQAAVQLAQAKHLSDRIGSALLRNRCCLAEAEIAFNMDDEEKALHCLREALALGCEKGFVSMLCHWQPDAMARCCAKALAHGIEGEYVKRLIRELHLLPTEDSPEEWPYPLKIYTFARFEIIRNGEPLAFSGKVQKKPLKMLRVLIALGGKDVAEEKITNILWPDAEGDAAHRSFETALYRLRLLLGVDKAVRLSGGRVSLDPRYCWLDAWAFDRTMDMVESNPGQQNASSGETVRLLERAVGLYRGPFLAADGCRPWAVSIRERLGDRFGRAVGALGQLAEKVGQLEKAIGYYQKGLELNALAEELYQHLMACHHQLGQPAKALAFYHRCRSVLHAKIGRKPSARTEALCKRIKQDRGAKP